MDFIMFITTHTHLYTGYLCNSAMDHEVTGLIASVPQVSKMLNPGY